MFVQRASAEVIGGRLRVRIDLKGDLPGHPFRGNQWTGGQEGSDQGDVSRNPRSSGGRHFDYITSYEGGDEIRPGLLDPDEPHSAREAWLGTMKDTSPPNPPGLARSSLREWANEGASMIATNSLIRAAASDHFGLPRGSDFIENPHGYDGESVAKNLIESIDSAPPAQPTLWRGIAGESPEYLSQMKTKGIGDTIEFSLGSASRDAQRAGAYGTNGILLRILPGAKGVANRKYFVEDQEVITGGKFEVVGKSEAKDGRTVLDVKQVETYKW